MKPKAETVVHFCVKKFLYVMENHGGRHPDPYESVVKALQKKYNIDRGSAYDTVRRPYWYLMDTAKVLHYKGVDWEFNGRQVDIGDTVRGILKLYRGDIEEIIAEWHKI
jgi:hypothetical protein